MARLYLLSTVCSFICLTRFRTSLTDSRKKGIFNVIPGHAHVTAGEACPPAQLPSGCPGRSYLFARFCVVIRWDHSRMQRKVASEACGHADWPSCSREPCCLALGLRPPCRGLVRPFLSEACAFRITGRKPHSFQFRCKRGSGSPVTPELTPGPRELHGKRGEHRSGTLIMSAWRPQPAGEWGRWAGTMGWVTLLHRAHPGGADLTLLCAPSWPLQVD